MFNCCEQDEVGHGDREEREAYADGDEDEEVDEYKPKKFNGSRRSRSRSRSLSIHKKSERTDSVQVFVGNLPFSVSSKQLREAFRDFGDIFSCEVVKDDRGNSKGFGIIKFTDKKAADEAIREMDQAKFNDRFVSVRYDNKNY